MNNQTEHLVWFCFLLIFCLFLQLRLEAQEPKTKTKNEKKRVINNNKNGGKTERNETERRRKKKKFSAKTCRIISNDEFTWKWNGEQKSDTWREEEEKRKKPFFCVKKITKIQTRVTWYNTELWRHSIMFLSDATCNTRRWEIMKY